MKNFFTAFMMAWGNFLSIPCPKKVWDNNLKKEMLSLLPIIGLIAGLIEYALCLVTRRFLFPVSVSAFLLTLIAFGISGFMHADGFMDCCDAILSRRDLAERQRILKDSRVGAFAVISMILMALGTFAAFFAICEREMATLAISYTLSQKVMTVLNPIALIMIPVISRATAGACVLGLKPLQTSQYAERGSSSGEAAARKTENVSGIVPKAAISNDRSIETKNNLKRLGAAVIIIFFVVLIITTILGAKISTQALWIFVFRLIVPTVVTLLATRLFAEMARRNLGGMSGDIAGFSICMGELIGYIVLALVLSMVI